MWLKIYVEFEKYSMKKCFIGVDCFKKEKDYIMVVIAKKIAIIHHKLFVPIVSHHHH